MSGAAPKNTRHRRMKFADCSLNYRKHSATMTDQTNVQSPKDGFPVIRKIGRAMTKMMYLELIIYLVLGLVALVVGGANWLGEILK